MATAPGQGNGDAEFRRRLTREVSVWAADGVVSAEQAASILRRYPTISEAEAANEVESPLGMESPASGRLAADSEDSTRRTTLASRAVSIIGLMGAVLVGVGIIIYVAANWDVIPVWARIAMLVALTAALNGAGWLLLARFDYPRVGIAALVAGALSYGAGIHLVAQIYHVPVNHPNLTTAWFLGVLPVAYLARSRVMVGLSLVLLALAVGFRTQWWLRFYGEDSVLVLAPMALLISAAVCALGSVQFRHVWTRSVAPYSYYSGLAAGIVAFCVMAIASIWIDPRGFAWEVLSAEYWITAIVVALVIVIATASLWRSNRDPNRALRIIQTVTVATMAPAAGLMWVWFAYPIPVLWWLFVLVAFAGAAAIAFLRRSLWLLGYVSALFLILTAHRFVSLVDLDSAAAPILLAASGLTMAGLVLAVSVASTAIPVVGRSARYCGAVGLAMAAVCLHVMGYATFWRWDSAAVWSWTPIEYWIVVALGWLLSASAVGYALRQRRGTGEVAAPWGAGAVVAMTVLALLMWLGLRLQVSASWAVFNLAFLAGVAALACYAYRSRQPSIAYFAGFVFAFFVVVRCFAALDILARDGLLLWSGPVVLGIGGLAFVTGRLRVRWADISRAEARTNFRVWDLGSLLLAIASMYAMSYSDPWEPSSASGGAALAFLAEYWLLSGMIWAVVAAVLVVIWIADAKRLPSMPVPPGQLAWETSCVAAMVALAVLSWLGLILAWEWTWLLLNGALLCTVLGLVAAGYRWNRPDLINLAVGVFAITLFTRYFEFGFGLLGQALAFIVAGAIMLIMGFGLEFMRRRMLRDVRLAGLPG